jgi:hypothetical protein
MTNAKPRLALALNTMYFGFPILIKQVSTWIDFGLNHGILLLLPYVLITKKNQPKRFHLSLIVYVLFAQMCGMEYRHTNLKRQALLTNLSPWVVLYPMFFKRQTGY